VTSQYFAEIWYTRSVLWYMYAQNVRYTRISTYFVIHAEFWYARVAFRLARSNFGMRAPALRFRYAVWILVVNVRLARALHNIMYGLSGSCDVLSITRPNKTMLCYSLIGNLFGCSNLWTISLNNAVLR